MDNVNIRAMLKEDHYNVEKEIINNHTVLGLKDVIDDLFNSGKKIILTIGDVGVGKTIIATKIASGLAERGKKIYLAITDPVVQLDFNINEASGITMSYIDEKAELEEYQEEVLSKARETMSAEQIAYVEEDMKSPFTQEIALLRTVDKVIDKAKEQAEEQAQDRIVVIDTAPTGNTLLLLESTQSENQETKSQQHYIPESAKKILSRLRNAKEVEVIIVTLAEATPVYEAMRLEDDLRRADINTKWWVINSSQYNTGNTNDMLLAKSSNEAPWINKVDEHAGGNYAIIGWSIDEIK